MSIEEITLGSGCFWCTEAVFSEVKGIDFVDSGYSGGDKESANYNSVSSGSTKHAECTNIVFNHDVISLDVILDIFFATHDPTTKDRQGNDVGPQYRSVIFYRDENQKELAESKIQELDKAGLFKGRIVTEVSKFKAFYPAEVYHQNYYKNNPDQLYCQFVISPKMSKFRKQFEKYLK